MILSLNPPAASLTLLLQSGRMLDFNSAEQARLAQGVTSRLLLAAFLGGLIGLLRAYHRKPSGVRTNLLICFGSAMFTFLSPVLAGELGNNKGQIAANVVQGIGFLGAGLILHNRDRVNGLTSAATVFVVASIGMACGAGLYLLAVFAALVVLLALEAIGAMEHRLNLKAYILVYEVRAPDLASAKVALLAAMDRIGLRLAETAQDSVGTLERISFDVAATRRGHEQLLASLRQAPEIDAILTFHDAAED